MRTYGRVTDVLTKKKTWIVVETDARGFDDYVWATTLCQCLKLNLGESPFYADYGIPAHPSVVTQVQPDFYVARTQRQFASRFASLIIAKTSTSPNPPVYRVNVITRFGTVFQQQVAA